MSNTKSTISQKLKIAQKTHELKNPFQNMAHLLRYHFFYICGRLKGMKIFNKIDIIQEMKIGKLIFHSCQLIGPKKIGPSAQNWTISEGEGCIYLLRTWPIVMLTKPTFRLLRCCYGSFL